MDMSDGLAKDLARMCSASGCGAQVGSPSYPCRPARKALAADPRPDRGHCRRRRRLRDPRLRPADKASDFVAAARAAGVEVTRIGQPQQGPAT